MPVKAFDLLPVLENTEFKIECFESSGNMLYLGTDDGFVLEYAVEERNNKSNNIVYISNLVCQKHLNNKKAVIQIRVTSALSRVLVLNDNYLHVLDSYALTPISSISKMKNVSTFCVNENPNNMDPFTLQFCIGKKKSIQVCSLHEDHITLMKEVSIPEMAINMSMDGIFVCVATQTQYSVYNAENGNCQDLFPCESSHEPPIIQRISKEEFLLAGPGNLGMFVTTKGTSERPPIQWSDGICSVSYYYPYVLAITANFICIYSLIDQLHKQTLLLNGGKLLGNFDGQLYVGTDSSVHCLMPKPWTSQVMDLLDDGSVEEAIALLEHSGGAGMTTEKFVVFSQTSFQRAGFLKFAAEQYEQAQDYFIQGKLDIRELISLFPGLLVLPFARGQPPLHQMADINQVCHGSTERIDSAKLFLRNFLLHLRRSGEPVSNRLELDTTLIKLYSETDPASLLVFLDEDDISCSLDHCIEWLRDRKQYAAASKLYRCFDRIENCLEILAKLFEGELEDEFFVGIGELVDVIISSKDTALVFRYADFILERDSNEGLRLFCETCHLLDHNQVLECLSKHPRSKYLYLHHLIYVLKIENGSFHTQLVIYYIDETTHADTDVADVTNRLRDLLNYSSLYNPKIILAKLQEAKLIEEMATVYGLLNDHAKALKLLVQDLRDFEAAEQYCINRGHKSNQSERSHIFMTLLKIYLDVTPNSSGSEREVELAAAMGLLEKHAKQMDLKEVLQIVPANLSISLLSQFLRAALRETTHTNNMKKLENSLIKSEFQQQKYIYHKLCSDMGPIVLTPNSICCVCGKNLTDCDFSIYPNGVLTHSCCAKNPHVCPLTGTLFKVKSNKG